MTPAGSFRLITSLKIKQAYSYQEACTCLLYSGTVGYFLSCRDEISFLVKVFITGAAGFIGFHLCRALLAADHVVYGIDNLNEYYDPAIKSDRLQALGITLGDRKEEKYYSGKFHFSQLDLVHKDLLSAAVQSIRPDMIIHLAAQAGVRYSIHQPQSFIDSNVQGLFNLLEVIRLQPVQHFIYASSSSVYGSRTEIPFKEDALTSQPVSLYGATKKAGEVIVHSYAELYKIPATGLRFFTVYGPWGRPDMAYYKFADLISRGESIDVYNHGKMARDFTFVDDIIDGIMSLLDKIPEGHSAAPHRIFNIGRSQPVTLIDFIELLEKNLGKKSSRNYLPMQQGEMVSTWADTSALTALTGYRPSIDLEEGIRRFADWYKTYHTFPSAKILV